MKRSHSAVVAALVTALGCAGQWGPTSSAGPDGQPAPDVAADDVAEGDGTGPGDGTIGADGTDNPGGADDGTPLADPAADDGATALDEGPDLTAPQVVSAFSTDGKGVTVRFSEEIEPATAGVAAFQVKGSDGSTLAVVAATPSGLFVTLELDPATTIDAKLTYTVWVTGVKDTAGNVVDPKARSAAIKRSVYVALVWHQHQPFYADAKGQQLTGPWVRKHSTKDYYDMAAIVGEYPDVHVTINLTAVLLKQLIDFYLTPMGDVDDGGAPLIDTAANHVNAAAFLAKHRGRTDPWIDLLLDPTPDPEGKVAAKPTDRQIELFYNAPWCTLSTSDQLMHFFPQYQALRAMAPTSYTHDDLLMLKLLFEIAWFDPDFLNGAVAMPDGTTVDLSDVVTKDGAGLFRLKMPVTQDATTHFVWGDAAAGEALANRLVAENYKVMKNVVPIHKKLRYDATAHTGQIEVATTPFYHPILPLLYSTDEAKQSMPFETLPAQPYSYPDDAFAQVAKAVRFYQDLFGAPPRGMWPGEGSVAEHVVPAFVANGLTWIATDQQNLYNTLTQLMSAPTPPCYQCAPYRIDTYATAGGGNDPSQEMAIVFRNTDLSNKIGFTYQSLWGQQATADFMKDVGAMAPSFGGGDRLVTVILDGENAWESYVKEHDAKGFFHALYKALQDGYQMGEVVPVTVAEYLDGNSARNVPKHAIHDLKELKPLWAGSWINGDFGIWIGEWEENSAWDYLRKTRLALETSGPPRPNPSAGKPDASSGNAVLAWQTWEELYAAEGSDWFWWYGDDMTSPAGDDSPFDMAFRAHLNGTYTHLNEWRAATGKPAITVPDYPPIVQAKAQAVTGPFTVAPTIDGKEDPPDEWAQGGLFYDNDSGAIANPLDDIAAVRYGYTNDTFFCALEMNKDASQKLQTAYGVSIYLSQKHITDVATGAFTQNPFNTKDRWGADLGFVTGGAAWEVYMDFTTKPAKTSLFKADGAGHWVAAGGGVQGGGPVPGGKVLEFAAPFATLGIGMGDPLEFAVVAGTTGGTPVENDRAPNNAGKMVFEDATSLVYVTFEVDVTGSKVAIDTYGSINNPPPPKGKGLAYISGNQDKLGLWVPNKIGLRDDGKGGDATAGDNVWTGVFGFMPGTLLRYKYTLGVPTDEAHWPGTEEFPLTERGLDVTKDPTCKKMKIHDVFADRPQPTGTAGKASVVDACVK